MMSPLKHAQFLFRQMIHNLDEPGWASRHVDDQENEGPTHRLQADNVGGVSSLALALNTIGLVRQSSDRIPLEYDA